MKNRTAGIIPCQLFWHPVLCMKGWNNGRFYWNVLHWICSCYCCLATNWQATVLAMGLTFLLVCWNPVLVSGWSDFAACCCWSPQRCAWEHFSDSHGKVPGLEGAQCHLCSCAAVLDRLELQCELESKRLWPVQESTVENKTKSPWRIPCWSRWMSKGTLNPSEPCSGAGSWHDLWTHGRAPLWSSSWSIAACVGRRHIGEAKGSQYLFWVLTGLKIWLGVSSFFNSFCFYILK